MTIAHRTLADLQTKSVEADAGPRHQGVIEMLVRRPDVGTREVVDEARLDTEVGMVGDNWLERGSGSTEDGVADPLRQLTVMSSRVLEAVAGDRNRWPLAGDQLVVDLDISHDNLPAGSRLQVGTAVIEITEPPHAGCPKFKSRFGGDALRWVNGSAGRRMRRRGANARVVEPGTVRTGDAVTPLR